MKLINIMLKIELYASPAILQFSNDVNIENVLQALDPKLRSRGNQFHFWSWKENATTKNMFNLTFSPNVTHVELYPTVFQRLILKTRITELKFINMIQFITNDNKILRLFLGEMWKMCMAYQHTEPLIKVFKYVNFIKENEYLSFHLWDQMFGPLNIDVCIFAEDCDLNIQSFRIENKQRIFV